VVLDARRDEVYAAIYGPGAQVRHPTTLLSPAALGLLLADHAPALLVGDGARLYAETLLAAAPQHRVGALQPGGPALGPLAAAALVRLEAGERPHIASIQPVYLRDHDAAKKAPA